MKGLATSFADTEDRRRYDAELKRQLALNVPRAKAEALARKKGDPGIGWMDNDLVNDPKPVVAVPREAWFQKWRTKQNAHGRTIKLTIGKRTETVYLGDTMPSISEINNGGVIDLAPAAQRLFGLKAPFSVPCSWEWA